MTPEEARKIKVGDEVGLEVDYVDEDGDVLVKDGFGNTRVKPSAIVSHTPAPKPALKVGDRVIAGDSGTTWEIAFIEGGQYAHFAVIPKTYKRRVPAPLSEVETWERLS